MRIAVIGAGPAGLAAAYDFARAKHSVTVYEASAQVGGLAGGFRKSGWDWSLEFYYHHWFDSDAEMKRLASDLGVTDRLIFREPVTAVCHDGRFYPFDSPSAVLRFPGLPLVDRVRFGMAGAYLKATKNWKKLEHVTAHRWLPRYAGKRAYAQLWEPMLEGKFGPYYKEVNMAWFWARIHARTRRLGTFAGGFQAFFEAAAEGVRGHGGQIRLESPVERIESAAGGLSVHAGGEEEVFDRVLSTTSPQLLERMVPTLPESYLANVHKLRSLGAVVLVVVLDRPLGESIYWYNLPKSAGFPFLALVEHTRFLSPEHYGGDHILYLGDYVPTDHRYLRMTHEELLAEFLPALSRINPKFSRDWVRDSRMFRASYAQPVPLVDHSKNIPDVKTPIEGLWWASMSQVYPWDRGTNFAIEIGRETARRIM